jgi:hypothetical protein
VTKLRAPRRTGIGYAGRKGIGTSFVVPAGAHFVRVELKRGNKVLLKRVVPAGAAGTREAVRFRGHSLRNVLRRGTFRIAVSAGATRATFGPSVVAKTVVH